MKDTERVSLRPAPGGVKVVPGASRDKIVGVLGYSLKIATASAAEKGKANAAVANTLASALGVSPRDIELISGHTSPRKEFRIEGLSVKELRDKLKGCC